MAEPTPTQRVRSPAGNSEARPALYRLERTESGYKFTLYAMRGQGPESASGAGQARAHAGGGEVVHERVSRNSGGEYSGKGTEDNSRMARRNPRGEFREHPTGQTQKPRATVKVRRRR
jgi:hypothetical protein